MPRHKAHSPLKVFLNGRLVGHLNKSSAGAIDFQYDESWLAWEQAMPVSLSLPLREDRYTGRPVIAVFDNLLPDNDAIRRRLAERVRAEGDDAYSLLAAVGRDCVGALQFIAEGIEPAEAGKIEGVPAADKDIAAILSNLSAAPLGVTEDDEFRISIAGAQEKTALLQWKGSWHIPHGNTATTHILKPQIGILINGIDLSQSVENEHFCMEFLTTLGLPVAKTQIYDFDNKRVLVVERFDRQWTKDNRLLRLPQEDCCQALSVPPGIKYEPDGGPGIREIINLLKGSDDPENDQRVFLKAQICFWLLGATDGHAKNFSIFLGSGGRFRLTPLYDVMSAQPAVDAGQIRKNKMKLAMAVGDKRHYVIDTIQPRHFMQTAAQVSLPADIVTHMLDELADDAPKALEKTLSRMPSHFPEALAASIGNGVKARLRNTTPVQEV